MKIVNTNNVDLSCIDIGEFFTFNNELYLRTDDGDESNHEIVGVSCVNGNYCLFTDGVSVQQAQASLKPDEDTIEYSDLRAGDVFEWEGRTCIATNEKNLCVEIISGCVYTIRDADEVMLSQKYLEIE